MFIDDCELEFGFLQNYGYKLEQKKSNNKYEQIIWNKSVNGLKIEIYHELYEFSIYLLLKYKNQKVDVKKAFNEHSISYNEFYQYNDEGGLHNGLLYFSEKLKILFSLINETELKENYLINETTINEYYLKKADQLYLSGNYKEAEHYYTREGVTLNDVQKMRLKRIQQL